MNTIPLTPHDLAIAAVLLLLVALSVLPLDRWLSGSIVVAAFRTVVQLLLIGYILKFIFAAEEPLWLGLVALVMLLVATREAVARQRFPFRAFWSHLIALWSIFLGAGLTLSVALWIVIRPEPWFDPRYVIPLMGMVVGNTMTGVALALNQMTELATGRKAVIEAQLMLGYTARTAMRELYRQSLHNALTPVVNAMATAGLVSLPGMMTGQILAGNPPLEAVKYQILVMFSLTSATGAGVLLALELAYRRLFDERERLRLDRLRRSSG